MPQFPQQNHDEVRRIVEILDAGSKKKDGGRTAEGRKPVRCRKTTYEVPGSDIVVDSWRLNDWDYKRPDLPTYARGLFTTVRKDGKHEIAVRGYDKFFNVDEVNDTKWRNIENFTKGPYELSVKENGCIIFMSGLEDGTLLVCSKHSTGPREDVPVSHAQAGERWIEKHLASVGKTKRDLAAELRRMNATAVGELCDDSFEEHVLAYDENAAGIYLHGINFNVPEFVTLSCGEVHEFADKWGFKKAAYVTFNDVPSVKEFLDKCAETGSWNGRDTEGFVVRCKKGKPETGYRDWFFKYKFDEPYLMYRQWRECTKAIIAGKIPKIKKHVKITQEYLEYAKRQLAKDPELGKRYNQNHGIIAMRDGFLRERGLKGAQIIAMEAQGELDGLHDVTQGVILVPVASIGCGKTTLALALVKLFGWGHIQNDNLPKQKNKAKKFAEDVIQAARSAPVVIADRNNHQRRERKQIMDDVSLGVADARYVALHYVHEPKTELLDDIRAVTRERVLNRGDNHQTIRAASKDTEEIIGIMEGFLHRFEAVDTDRDPDANFHEVIDLEVGASSRENLEKVVKQLHRVFPKIVRNIPSAEEMDRAIESAMHEYKVQEDLSWGSGSQKSKKNKQQNANNEQEKAAKKTDPNTLVKKIEYVGISLPSSPINELLQSLFAPGKTSPERAKLYNHLVHSRRIQPTFHVTLIHRSHNSTHPDVWKKYTDLYLQRMQERLDQGQEIDPSTPPKLGDARVRIERLVWSDKIMAFVVRILPPATDGEGGDSWPCVNPVAHITVGTASSEVKPKESNDLLQQWLQVGSGEGTGIWEAEVPGYKVLDGEVRPVMMRGK